METKAVSPGKDMDSGAVFTKKVIETVIRLAILGVLVMWAFQLIKPFLIPVLWGVILSVATEPFISRIAKAFGGRRALVSALFVLLIIAGLVIPALLLVVSSIDTIHELAGKMHESSLRIPPPPAAIADWPVVGEKLHQSWQLASTNLMALLQQYTPQLKSALVTIVSSIGSGFLGFFMVIISTCIAGVFLAKSEQSAALARKIIIRFAGERGHEIADLAVGTIRGVMQGVVVVAVIQAILSMVGMIMAGVPGAGIWALLVMICAVSQLPPILILGPVAAYVFSANDTTPAVIFLVWALFVSSCDSFLKPMLMGRGVDMPMLVILLGALGGMMLSGIIGLFVGAVVLAIMYTLFMAWLEESAEDETAADN